MSYDFSSEDDSGTVDIYFDEDGAGYQVMDISGEKMEMEWSK
jgi:hypothetical protein